VGRWLRTGSDSIVMVYLRTGVYILWLGHVTSCDMSPPHRMTRRYVGLRTVHIMGTAVRIYGPSGLLVSTDGPFLHDAWILNGMV